MQRNELIDRIFSIRKNSDFQQLALDVFAYQYKHQPVYREFCEHLNRTQPQSLQEIPFLPIAFFKSAVIGNPSGTCFMSSGTSGMQRSRHWVNDMTVYERSFRTTFSELLEPPEDTIILALLPNYVEQGDSSLVYMVDRLIRWSDHQVSGFYLDDEPAFKDALNSARQTNRKIIVFGVSFALLNLAEQQVDLSGVTVIETGGMKGRRREMVREELHERLREGFRVEKIYSEYGMTELLSQAYTSGDEWFKPARWMCVLIRDVNDPFAALSERRTGGINVIDLANIDSCAFIATDDLGRKSGEQFQVVGRFDQSDMRGCNLLVH
ncbi:MAG: acyl transferase [Bacteroidota bacterium]